MKSFLLLAWAASLSLVSAVSIADAKHQHNQAADTAPPSTSFASQHGPIGVMGDHLHKAGEVMISYRFMRMDMDGNRIGSRGVSAREVVGSMASPGRFMVAPTSMPMDMHMLGGMFGISDSITVMAMTSFVSNSMDHLIRNGRTFTTESSGMGDTKVSALISVFDRGTHKMHSGLGVSLPTGSIRKRDDTPAQRNSFLPYPMQLGSGTVDVLPSITYMGHASKWGWGAQISAILRTGDNQKGYVLGDRRAITGWLSRDINSSLSLSARLDFQDWDNIKGRNTALNPNMIQTANTSLQAGQRTDLSLGANYVLGNGHRIAFEYGRAIDQDLDGPQLETDSIWTLGWQKAF